MNPRDYIDFNVVNMYNNFACKLCSVRMREKTDQKNSKYGHFLRSEFNEKTVFNFCYLEFMTPVIIIIIIIIIITTNVNRGLPIQNM